MKRSDSSPSQWSTRPGKGGPASQPWLSPVGPGEHFPLLSSVPASMWPGWAPHPCSSSFPVHFMWSASFWKPNETLHFAGKVASVTQPKKWPIKCVCARWCPTLRLYGLQPARLLCPWDCQGKNMEVGCHFLLRGSSPLTDWICISCLCCIGRRVLYQLRHLGSPRAQEGCSLTLALYHSRCPLCASGCFTHATHINSLTPPCPSEVGAILSSFLFQR